MSTYDAIVVGARCAGSVVAGKLAREGHKVLLVDKATFPSDTVSTHAIFPNTLARFASLGILERLHDRFEIPHLNFRWRIVGYELAGPFTPVDGHEHATSIRRLSLDQILVEWAQDGGAQTRFGERIADLMGAGTGEDPVRGVELGGGEEITARWVIGADGRASTVAGLLGLEKKKPMVGEIAFLMAYWGGLPRQDFAQLDVNYSREGLMRNPSEDGTDLISVAGPPEITRGSNEDREKRYVKGMTAFPESFDAGLIQRAERISDLVVVPETMMRGFYRRANGPGWVLVGDAGHFKHPGTAQGISDAVEQAVYVADALSGSDPELAGFHDWRRDRSKEHYEWSFVYGSWPVPGVVEPYMQGLTSDPHAVQDWFDVFTRLKTPGEVNTPERLGKWMSTPVTPGP